MNKKAEILLLHGTRRTRIVGQQNTDAQWAKNGKI